MPSLGFYEGTLVDIIDHAMDLKDFFTWGGGGKIVKVPTPIKVNANTNQQRRELTEARDALQTQLSDLNARLKDLS